MIVRIVKLHLQPGKVGVFMDHFNNVRQRINAFPGCSHLEILKDAGMKETLFTWSHWKDEAALNGYLDSELFIDTWRKVKPLFARKAEAWSLVKFNGEN